MRHNKYNLVYTFYYFVLIATISACSTSSNTSENLKDPILNFNESTKILTPIALVYDEEKRGAKPKGSFKIKLESIYAGMEGNVRLITSGRKDEYFRSLVKKYKLSDSYFITLKSTVLKPYLVRALILGRYCINVDSNCLANIYWEENVNLGKRILTGSLLQDSWNNFRSSADKLGLPTPGMWSMDI